MLVVYRRKGVTIAEIWLDDACPDILPKVDLVRYCGCLTPINNSRCKIIAHNLVIDLDQEPEVLLSQMDETTRKHIRRAGTKDSVSVQVTTNCTDNELQEFCDFYDGFAQSRSLRPCVRQRLLSFAKQSGLVLTSAIDANGEVVVRHATLMSAPRATLLYTASMFRNEADSESRNLISRANRYLHWQDMLFFKSSGCSRYDMGGVDISGEDTQTSRITRFKLGFGRTIMPEYSATTARSLKGRGVLGLLHLTGTDF